jgi:hypothetical protein
MPQKLMTRAGTPVVHGADSVGLSRIGRGGRGEWERGPGKTECGVRRTEDRGQKAEARAAGCPQHHVVNFLRAGLVLKPRQLTASAASSSPLNHLKTAAASI